MFEGEAGKRDLIKLLNSVTEQDADIDNTFITSLCIYYFPKLDEEFYNSLSESPVLPAIMYKSLAATCDDEQVAKKRIEEWLTHPTWRENATTKECFHEFVRSMNAKKKLETGALAFCINMSLLEFVAKDANITCLKQASKTLSALYISHPNLIDLDVIVEIFIQANPFLTLNHFAAMMLKTEVMTRLRKHEEYREVILESVRDFQRIEEDVGSVAASLFFDLNPDELYNEIQKFPCYKTRAIILQKVLEHQMSNDKADANAENTFDMLEEYAYPEVDYFLPFVPYLKRGGKLSLLLNTYIAELRTTKYCSTQVLHKFLVSLSNLTHRKIFINFVVSLESRILSRPTDFLHLDLCRNLYFQQGIQTIVNENIESTSLDKLHAVIDIMNYFDEVVKRPLKLVFEPNNQAKLKRNMLQAALFRMMSNECVFVARDALKFLSRHFRDAFVQKAKELYDLREDTEFKALVVRSMKDHVKAGLRLAKKIAIILVYQVTKEFPNYDLFAAAKCLADELDPQFVSKERREYLDTVINDIQVTRKVASKRVEGKARVDDILRTLSGPNQGHTNCVDKECY